MLNVLDNKKYTIKQQLREKQIDFMPTLRVFVTVLSFFECFLNIRGPAGYLSFFFVGVKRRSQHAEEAFREWIRRILVRNSAIKKFSSA